MNVITKEKWESFKKTTNKDQLIEFINDQITARDRAQEAYTTALTREKELGVTLEELIVMRDTAASDLASLKESSDITLEELTTKHASVVKETNLKQIEINRLTNELDGASNEVNDLRETIKEADDDIILLNAKLNGRGKHLPARRRFGFRLPRFITIPIAMAIFCIIVLGAVYTYNHGTGFLVNVYDNVATAIVKQTGSTDPLKGMLFVREEQGMLLVMDAYQETMPPDVYEPMMKWAKAAGFDCLIVGRIHDYGAPMLSGKYDLRIIAGRLEDMGIRRAIAIVDNPAEFELPSPISVSTIGPLNIYKGSMKLASFIPIPLPWTTVVKVTARNFNGTVDDGQFTAKIEGFKMSVVVPVIVPEPH